MAVPSLELIRRHGARSSCVVLTHPHQDHAAGIDLLLGRHEDGPVGVNTAVVDLAPRTGATPDAQRRLWQGEVEHALAAIQTSWQSDPGSRWDLVAGEERIVGGATLRPLYPTVSATQDFSGALPEDLNRLSTPLSVSWNQLQIVLGADLPWREWEQVCQHLSGGNLSEHNALKIAHHGSKGAQHRCIIQADGEQQRTWICTPWNRGLGLPRFESKQGIDILLAENQEVHLTALPTAVGWPEKGPHEASRADVMTAIEHSKFANLILEYAADEAPAFDAWVAVGLDAAGERADLRRGSTSVKITA
jgi:hypothetical protein